MNIGKKYVYRLHLITINQQLTTKKAIMLPALFANDVANIYRLQQIWKANITTTMVLTEAFDDTQSEVQCHIRTFIGEMKWIKRVGVRGRGEGRGSSVTLKRLEKRGMRQCAAKQGGNGFEFQSNYSMHFCVPCDLGLTDNGCRFPQNWILFSGEAQRQMSSETAHRSISFTPFQTNVIRLFITELLLGFCQGSWQWREIAIFCLLTVRYLWEITGVRTWFELSVLWLEEWQ